jgi:uncharacterized short protein YbdD (DUF466 family)
MPPKKSLKQKILRTLGKTLFKSAPRKKKTLGGLIGGEVAQQRKYTTKPVVRQSVKKSAPVDAKVALREEKKRANMLEKELIKYVRREEKALDKKAAKPKRGLSEYNKFVKAYAKKHPGDPNMISNAAAAWRGAS